MRWTPGDCGTPVAPGPYAGVMSGHEQRIAGRAAVPGQSGQDPGRIAGRASVPVSPPAGGGAGGSGGSGGSGRGFGGGRPHGHPIARVARRRGRWRRAALVTLLTMLLVAGLGLAGLVLYLRGLDNNMGRINAFGPITAERPAETGTLNILLLGSDSRDPDGSDGPYRADTIMLMHVPAAGDHAYLISIPRDLWVYVPPNAAGTQGGREAKINASTAWGDVPLMVQTVEGYTGVRVDHVMLIDFAGFVEVTDAVGGVEMEIEQTITSIHRPHRTFEAGHQHLNGEQALDYIRQRYQFADSDFTRMRNQQQFLRALMDRAASRDTLTNPARLHAFLQTATSTLTVDEDFSLVTRGFHFRNLRGQNLTFLTSPHAGTGMVGSESVVFSDDAAAAELYQALRADRMAQWVEANPDQVRD
jgi:LCP family protein required for cell wall assembly